MNDCLGLPLRQGAGGTRTLGGWESLWMSLGEGEAERLPAGRGEGWEPAQVPGQRSAVEGRQAIWYRTSFPRPDHSGRLLLRVGGAFLAANVWLNGRLLGAHYGYFAPFGFDVTPFLRESNLLVICCEAPIETDLARKRHVMGIFNDGDSRPYPSSAFFSLPDEYRWEVPVGLWRPVELEYLGPVSIDWMRCKPRLEAGDVGRLEIETRLRNLDGRDMSGELAFEITAPDAAPLRLRREFRIPGGLEKTISTEVSIPDARRWCPWRYGDSNLYQAALTVLVEGRPSAEVRDSFGFRQLEMVGGADGWSLRVNGQPMFLRGANYSPSIRLDQLTVERFDADLKLAREANLDALRVHAHVLPEEFYRRADAAGMLVIADFPLTLAYAYHATDEESRFFETSVREQVPEMVEMLRNRPSVAAWIAHDDPPWIAANSELADVHAVRQNHTIDDEAQSLFARLDPSRLALAASGQFDSHLYLGWREGGWQDFGQVEPGLVTELGAQSLPSLHSPVWDQLGRQWPVGDDPAGWIYAGYQAPAWAERGVGLPSSFGDLGEYVAASQEYQAWLIGYAVDQLRRQKFEGCWGVFVYQLVDAFPGIGFSVLDHERVPKLAYEALREGMAPVRLIADPLHFTALEPIGFGYEAGSQATVRLVVVNDDPAVHGAALVRWSVRRERAAGADMVDRFRDAVRRKSFSGSVELELPAHWEPATQVASLSLSLAAEGEYVLEAELTAAGRTLARASLEFMVGVPHRVPRGRPALPAYLAERLVEAQSLRSEETGFSLRLLNRTRPAVLTRVTEIKLDGRAVPGAAVTMESATGRIPLPKRLDLPVARPLTLHISTGKALQPGEHEVELDVTLPGIASGRLRVSGVVGSGDARVVEQTP